MREFNINPDTIREFRTRLLLLIYIVFVLFIIVIFRVLYLQIIESSKYEMEAKENMQQIIPINAPRGEIYDRNYRPDANNNVPLVYNKREFAIKIMVYNFPKKLRSKALKRCIKNLSMVFAKYEDKTKTARQFEIELNKILYATSDINYPITLRSGVKLPTLFYIAEHINNFPNVYWENDIKRGYLFDDDVWHILGYVGVISKKELEYYKKHYPSRYHLNSIVGKAGIEKQYDLNLRGFDGRKVRIVDAHNIIQKERVAKEYIPGNNIILTIDKDLQRYCKVVINAMEERANEIKKYKLMQAGEENPQPNIKLSGAIVITKPFSGEVLALYSFPGFSNREMKEEFVRIRRAKKNPFLNRCIQAYYSPGSSFKIITALAALQLAHIPPTRTYYCHGEFPYGNKVFKCEHVHNKQNMYQAIYNSCNIYFYQLALDTGVDYIVSSARSFGLGRKTGIDLPGEITGLVPSRYWKKKRFKEPWTGGDTINLSIGQGFLLVTPIQMNLVVSAIATGGTIYRPFIVKEIRSSINDKVIRHIQPQIWKRLSISKSALDIIRRSMILVTENGTAKYGCHAPNYKIAGKTGTAENIGEEPHSWFICYGPVGADKDKQIAISVLVENIGAGGYYAARIACALMRYYIEGVDYKDVWQYLDQRWVNDHRIEAKPQQIAGEEMRDSGQEIRVSAQEENANTDRTNKAKEQDNANSNTQKEKEKNTGQENNIIKTIENILQEE